MKKLLSISAILLIAAAMFTGCASSDAKAAGGKDAAPAVTHPRTYVLDPYDAGEVWSLPKNQYGPNYQSLKTTSHFKLVKSDKPQAGDTVQIRMKFTSDIDIDTTVTCRLTDQSAAASYWTVLGEQDISVADSVKAGVPVEFSFDDILTTDVKGDFTLAFTYDESVGKEAKFTFEKVAESTDTSIGVVKAPHNSNPTVNIGKYAAFLEIATNHPWINGAQDMSVISNYQATPEVTNAFGDDLPVAGDVIHVTWKAIADADIKQIYIRAVDCSSDAGWWKELCESASGYVLVENVVAGEPFECSVDIPLTADPVAQVNFCMWYDIGDANPDGPAIFKFVKE